MMYGHTPWRVGLMGLAAGLGFVLGGCADSPTTRPATAQERANQALRDPFNYKPDSDFQDISGGGITDLDKGALKRDIDHVLNP